METKLYNSNTQKRNSESFSNFTQLFLLLLSKICIIAYFILPSEYSNLKPNYVKIISTDIDSDNELIDVENSSGEFVPIQENSQISSDEAQSEIMDTESYVDTDPSDVFTPCPNFKERCLQEVKQSDLLDVIIDKLHRTSQLHDFMCLLRDLKCGNYHAIILSSFFSLSM